MLQILSTIALILTQAGAEGLSPTSPPPTLEELPERIEQLLSDPKISDALVSVHVVRVEDKKELFAKAENELRVPASTIKLFTTAAALDVLGPDYRFKTEIYGTAPKQGVVAGDIHLKGYGDPWLVPERFWYFANRLKYAGVSRIDGDIVVDEAVRRACHRRRARVDTSSAYMAPAGTCWIQCSSRSRITYRPGPARQNRSRARV